MASLYEISTHLKRRVTKSEGIIYFKMKRVRCVGRDKIVGNVVHDKGLRFSHEIHENQMETGGSYCLIKCCIDIAEWVWNGQRARSVVTMDHLVQIKENPRLKKERIDWSFLSRSPRVQRKNCIVRYNLWQSSRLTTDLFKSQFNEIIQIKCNGINGGVGIAPIVRFLNSGSRVAVRVECKPGQKDEWLRMAANKSPLWWCALFVFLFHRPIVGVFQLVFRSGQNNGEISATKVTWKYRATWFKKREKRITSECEWTSYRSAMRKIQLKALCFQVDLLSGWSDVWVSIPLFSHFFFGKKRLRARESEINSNSLYILQPLYDFQTPVFNLMQ